MHADMPVLTHIESVNTGAAADHKIDCALCLSKVHPDVLEAASVQFGLTVKVVDLCCLFGLETNRHCAMRVSHGPLCERLGELILGVPVVSDRSRVCA